MALGFGDVPLEIVIRASNQLAPGLAAAGAQLKAFKAEVGAASGQLSFAGMGMGGGGLGGLAGAIGPTLGIAAGVAVIGGAVAAGKSLIDTYRAQQTALADLKQAYDSVNLPFKDYLDGINTFLDQQAPYISDINAVREGFASLTRAGIDQKLVQQGVSDALNLSILKHQDFATSLQIVLLGLEGNARGLKTLGINVKDYGDLTRSATQIQNDDAAAKKKVEEATVNLSKAQRVLAEDLQRLHDKGYVTANDLMHEQDLKAKVAVETQKVKDAQANYNVVVQKGNDQAKNQSDLLTTIGGKVVGARGTLDMLTMSQNNLNREWEKFSGQVAPGLVIGLASIVDGLNSFVNVLTGIPGVINNINAAGGRLNSQQGGHFVGGGHGSQGTWVPNAQSSGSGMGGSGGGGGIHGGI